MTTVADTLSKELDAANTVGASQKVAIKALRELDKVTAEHDRLAYLLSRIITDLPDKKDWLDPAVEREAKELLKELQK